MNHRLCGMPSTCAILPCLRYLAFSPAVKYTHRKSVPARVGVRPRDGKKAPHLIAALAHIVIYVQSLPVPS